MRRGRFTSGIGSLGLGLLMTLALSGCSPTSGEPMTEEVRAETHRLYVTSCARCHQIEGDGFEGLYPALAGNPLVMLHDPDPVINIVVNGSGSMPAFRHSLADEEIARLVSYIRSSWGNEAAEVGPSQVR